MGTVFTGGAVAQVDVNASTLAGNGTADDPYVITNASELQAMEDDLDAHYELGNDIDASETAEWNNGKGFDPIGGDPSPDFAGSFDGAGHTISGLTIIRPNETQVGLFGHTNFGTPIENVSLTGVYIESDGNAGGLVGFSSGPVANSHVTGTVNGPTLVGGLVGNNNDYIISNSSTVINVTGDSDGLTSIGGLVGYSGGGEVRHSYALGPVEGRGSVGGLIGTNNGNITESYATGPVSGVSGVGGLVGGNTGMVTESYATGNATADRRVGGLIGSSSGTVNNSSATGAVIAVEKGTGDDGTQAGGLLGVNDGLLKQSIATGNVRGTNRIGGLVGKNADEAGGGYITESVATGDVIGNERGDAFGYIGGLVGDNTDVIPVYGGGYYDMHGTINKSYATGNVTGTESVGGLLGNNDLRGSGSVAESYATGTVIGSEKVGGLVGEDPNANVTGSYWDRNTTNQSTSAGGTGLTTAEMTGPAASENLTGFDFEETWDTTDSYPELSRLSVDLPPSTAFNYTPANPQPGETVVFTAQSSDPDGTIDSHSWSLGDTTTATGSNISHTFTGAGTYRVILSVTDDHGNTDTMIKTISVGNVNSEGPADASPVDLAGTGTADSPYIITNASELQAIEDDLDAHYELGNDIDASETAEWNGGDGFEPLGEFSIPLKEHAFSGTLDGAGHTVDGLTINRSSESQVGLFGYTYSNSTVEKVTLTDAYVSGNDNVGGLVGFNDGKVRSSHLTGSVNGSVKVGGLIGNNEDGEVDDSSTQGVVTSNQNGTDGVQGSDIGGLIGSNSGPVNDSVSKGTVSGVYSVGGLIGDNNGPVEHVSATVNVNGTDNVGGLIGFNFGPVTKSYATGEVTGSQLVGGLIGMNTETVNGSFATGTVSGSENVGGLVGRNDGMVAKSYWDTETTDQPSSAGGIGLNTPQMTGDAARTNMTALDFNNTWKIQENDYPELRNKTKIRWKTTRIAYGFLPSLAISGEDVPHVSYYGSGTDGGNADNLSYAVQKNGTWELENVVTGGTGQFSSLALSKSGNAEIIYEGGYRELTSRGWESVSGVGGEGTAIARNGSDSTPSVAYGQSGDIYYGELSSGTWQTATVAQNKGSSYISVGLGIDTEGQPHIAYINRSDWQDSNATVEYAYRSAGSWQTTVIDSASAGSWDDGVSIGVGPNGTLQIAYIHSSGEPRVATNDGNGWQQATIDHTVESVSAISMAIDDTGRSHLAYGESFDGRVKYASQRGDLDWSPQTVSRSMGDSGISIALNSSDSPRIVYEGSNENGNLIYAQPEEPLSDGSGMTDSGSVNLNTTDVTTHSGTNTTIQFELENTGQQNNSYILNLSLPEELSIVETENAGARWKASETKWLWQTISVNETVKPSVTVSVPESSNGTYDISGCAFTNDSAVVEATSTLTVVDNSLTVSPAATTIANGSTTSLLVEAPLDNGTIQNVTGEATYTSNNTDVATVVENGQVTAVATGTARLTASYDNRSANMTITVEPAPIREALDTNNNDQLDHTEILAAMDYWETDTPVPRTDGKTIDDRQILDLIETWRFNEEI